MSFKRAKQKVCHLCLIQNSFTRYHPPAYPEMSAAEYIQIYRIYSVSSRIYTNSMHSWGFGGWNPDGRGFIHTKHRPDLNVLQTGTATRGQCQFAVAEPRHISLHIFLLRVPCCCLSCILSTASLLQLPVRAEESSQGRCLALSVIWDVSWGSSTSRIRVYPLGCAACSCSC